MTEINRVLDGDTIDVTIDLGFDLYKKERVRVAGVDTPEKRTRDLEEKALGIDATNWLKEKLEGAIDGDDELTIRTELKGGVGKYGRLLGWLYIGDAELSLNELMITEGYAWAYDGGTKQKNFEDLREIRRSFGTLKRVKMKAAIKGFNGGLWAFRLVFAVVVAELLIVAGAVVGCFEEQICSDADTQAIKETMQGLATKSFALYACRKRHQL